jgi:hypothetical protein
MALFYTERVEAKSNTDENINSAETCQKIVDALSYECICN